MTTKLELVNRVLDSVHETRIQSTTQPLGNIVLNCVEQALIEVCTSADWVDTSKSSVASSYTTNVATVNTTVEDCRVASVKTWVASTKQFVLAGYVDKDEFDSKVSSSFAGSAGVVEYWTFDITSEKVKVQPYPSDAGGKALVYFDTQQVVKLPATDATAFTVPDRLLSLVELRASSLLSLKMIGDPKFYYAFDFEYKKLRDSLVHSEQGTNPFIRVQERQPQQTQQQQSQGGQ